MGKHIKALDSLFRQFNAKTSGCAVAVMKDGVLVHSVGYGMADIERRVPVSDETVFSIASNTKQFTAFCIFLLESRGKLKLNDDIRKYLPEIPRYAQSIRIRHLIHHTSGLRDQLDLFAMAGKGTDCTEAQTLRMLTRQKELNFAPGSEHLYSNAGYVLLGMIVHRVSGKSLQAFAKEEVFGPLGMRQTTICVRLPKTTPHAAYGYSNYPDPKVTRKIPIGGVCRTRGDGNGFSTVGDLLRWNQNLDSGALGGQRVKRRMHERAKLNNGKRLDYAGGIGFHTFHGVPLILHGGGDLGYASQLLRAPSLKLSVACLLNSDEKYDPTALAFKVVDHFSGWSAKPARKPRAAKPLDPARLKKYAGTFEDRESTIRVAVKKGGLWGDRDGYRFQLLPKAAHVFLGTRAWTGSELRFHFDAQGRLQHLGETWPKRRRAGKSYRHLPPTALDAQEVQRLLGRYRSDELATSFGLESRRKGAKTLLSLYPLGRKKDGFLAELSKFGDQYLLKQIKNPFPGSVNDLKLEPRLAGGRVGGITLHYPSGRVRRMSYRKLV